jgi:hypothetical protein
MRDFRFAPFVDSQRTGAGRIFLLAPGRRKVRGFGNDPLTRLRRVARLLLAELP